MLLERLLLLVFSIAFSTGPAPADAPARALDRSVDCRAALQGPGIARTGAGSLFGDLLSGPDELSPWDDEIEIPDDSEDEEPEDPGEALHLKTPARGHTKACSLSSFVERPAPRSSLAIVSSPHLLGSSRSPAALCRLLF